MQPHPATYQFKGFRLDCRARTLFAPSGTPVALTSKAFDVLVHLVEHADRVVTKDELFDRVWSGRVVEENNLSQAISALRRILGTGGGDRDFIVTIPGQGFRFVANVEPVQPLYPRGRRRAWPRKLGLVAALLAAVAILVAISRQQNPEFQAHPPPVPTLAVLPFVPVSDDPADELLALGLAETLITRLGRADGLRVRSLGSSVRSAGTSRDPLQAAHQLGAVYVVDGSTQRSGSALRVNIRLMRVAGGDVIWGGTYDADPLSVFAIQDRIALEITEALSVPTPASRLRPASPCEGDDAEAYRALLTGLRQIQTPSPASLRSAVGAFERAVDLDPNCARAFAGLAFVWRALSITADVHPRDAFPRAIVAVERALELDPDLAEAHASLGFIRFWHNWDWPAAESAFRRAIDLNPSLAEARFSYAHLLSNLGRHDEALHQAGQARALDPFWPLVNTLEAAFLHAAGRDAQARAQIARALELAPDFWIALAIRGTIALDSGDSHAAVADLERAAELSSGATQALALLGIAYVHSGRSGQAEQLLAQLESRARDSYVPATVLASIHNALGDPDRTMDLLDRAYLERDVRLAFLKVDARWNNLRDHPRFIELARRLALE